MPRSRPLNSTPGATCTISTRCHRSRNRPSTSPSPVAALRRLPEGRGLVPAAHPAAGAARPAAGPARPPPRRSTRPAATPATATGAGGSSPARRRRAPPRFLVPPVGLADLGRRPADRGTARRPDLARHRRLSPQMLGYAVEFHKKFAIPLGSFCFVLLGIALALKYPRGGIGLVIGASLVIFLGFYILLIGGENVAKKGYLESGAGHPGPADPASPCSACWPLQGANREMGSTRSGGMLQGLFGWLRRVRTAAMKCLRRARPLRGPPVDERPSCCRCSACRRSPRSSTSRNASASSADRRHSARTTSSWARRISSRRRWRCSFRRRCSSAPSSRSTPWGVTTS